MRAALIPQLFFLAGCLCFVIGTVMNIKQSLDATPANTNCGADRP